MSEIGKVSVLERERERERERKSERLRGKCRERVYILTELWLFEIHVWKKFILESENWQNRQRRNTLLLLETFRAIIKNLKN